MQTCKCQLKTNDYHIGNKTGVTPTEVVILRTIHNKEAGGNCIIKPILTGEALTVEVEAIAELKDDSGKVFRRGRAQKAHKRTNAEEVARLKRAYPVKARNGAPGTHILDDLYPGVSPELPQTFKEVGIEVLEQAPEEETPEHPESEATTDGERVVSDVAHPPQASAPVLHAQELLKELEALEAIAPEARTTAQKRRLKQLEVLKPEPKKAIAPEAAAAV